MGKLSAKAVRRHELAQEDEVREMSAKVIRRHELAQEDKAVKGVSQVQTAVHHASLLRHGRSYGETYPPLAAPCCIHPDKQDKASTIEALP